MDANYLFAKEGGLLPEWRTWYAMIARCTQRTHQGWPRYGGRGIKICNRWRRSFERFVADMGRRPGTAYSIDRIDNDGDYTPLNCRWATAKQQARNTRQNHLVSVGQNTKCVSAWVEELGISRTALVYRLRHYPAACVLTDPIGNLNRANRTTPRKMRRAITYAGRTQAMADWARELGISRQRLHQRLAAYPLERAMNPPSRNHPESEPATPVTTEKK